MRHEADSEVNRDPRLAALAGARLHDPASVLGLHREAAGWVVRALRPHAAAMALRVADGWQAMAAGGDGLFEWHGEKPAPLPLRLRADEGGASVELIDPWSFPAQIDASDLFLFNAGRLHQAYRVLGAQPRERDGVKGFRFACWAPNAERVSVVGDFNRWDGRLHPMSSRGASGVWELFVPGVGADALYKFEIRSRVAGAVLVKADPFARAAERRPGTASRTVAASAHVWSDDEWMAQRARSDWLHAPMNVYEVHAGSWRRHPDGRTYSYRELADALVPYVRDMGYTHIELLPLTEHPLDESWGYQSTGFFAPTSRYGSPDDLRALIDACHQAGIGVILDWVPGHFPRDAWALAGFDGTALFEHEDPRLGLHREWGTNIFNYGRREVVSFLLSSAHFWLAEMHVDGLRVDAVASMLYLDYSRQPGEWLPNRYGGRENLEAIEFRKALNVMVHDEFPGAVTIAEESTAWPAVSRPVHLGGLGFSMKWNMGWMNDSLRYFARDPVHRRFHHDELTFGQLYAYSENFVLPLSHDEVVHGKRALVDKMPGDEWRRFANARLLAAWQVTSPGRKLAFMGHELGQTREWSEARELDWWLLAHAPHRGMQALVRALNQIYRDTPALHQLDFDPAGFRWIDCHDNEQSVLVFERRARDGAVVAVALNFTPETRYGYRIGLPRAGTWREVLNTDASCFGGSDTGNGGAIRTEPQPWMDRPCSTTIVLPPLAAVLFIPDAR